MPAVFQRHWPADVRQGQLTGLPRLPDRRVSRRVISQKHGGDVGIEFVPADLATEVLDERVERCVVHLDLLLQ